MDMRDMARRELLRYGGTTLAGLVLLPTPWWAQAFPSRPGELDGGEARMINESIMAANPNAQTDKAAARGDASPLQVTPDFALELTALAHGYCTGIDLIGAGDMPAGMTELRVWFADHARFVYTFPPKYASLNFDVTGPQAFARVVNDLYRANGFVRTQHQVSNIRIERTGQDTATMRAYLSAVHMFPDERVFLATGKYVDAVERVNGQWKIVHRDEPITSCALLEAFPVH